MSLFKLEYAAKKKVTRRGRFLGELDAVTPWFALVAEIKPYYPKGTGRGQPPIGVERMLRVYIAQQCFGLSDEGIEDAIYVSKAIRSFVGINLARESTPDATTLLKFRRLLETHQLTDASFTPSTPCSRQRAAAQRRHRRRRQPFRLIKYQLGFTKVLYRGLMKNFAQSTTFFALSNLWMARKHLMGATG